MKRTATDVQAQAPCEDPESDHDSEWAVPPLDDVAFMTAVGGQLQKLRKTHGLSRRLFVKKPPWNIPENTYACYEQGIRPCPLTRLVVICQVLGTTVGQVVENALASPGLSNEAKIADTCLSNIDRALAEMTAARQRLLHLQSPSECGQ